ITVIDVGQGDSILVISPEGKTLLVDGGGPPGFIRSDSFDVGEDVVSPYLWSRGFTRLDVVALTHAHSDHMGGLRSVIANFRPRELWVGVDSDASGYRDLVSEASARGVVLRHLRARNHAAIGSDAIEVLAPKLEG